jgi:hypothetical protein
MRAVGGKVFLSATEPRIRGRLLGSWLGTDEDRLAVAVHNPILDAEVFVNPKVEAFRTGEPGCRDDWIIGNGDDQDG